MSFKINGTETEVSQGLTVGGLLKERNVDPQSVVVLFNAKSLPRTAYDETNIENGDIVEVLHFVGGG